MLKFIFCLLALTITTFHANAACPKHNVNCGGVEGYFFTIDTPSYKIKVRENCRELFVNDTAKTYCNKDRNLYRCKASAESWIKITFLTKASCEATLDVARLLKGTY